MDTTAGTSDVNAMPKHKNSTAQPEHPQLRRHSRNVWEYQPQAVIAPAGQEPRVHSGEELRQLMAAQPEAHTLFYDLFQSLDGKEVIALQAGEFAETFGDLNFSHRGQPLPKTIFRGDAKEGLAIWRIRLPRASRSTDIRLEISTGSGAQIELNVPPNPFAKWTRTPLFQQTQLKNYPFTLVRDHCLFHHRAHGFQRMVLYDNGSADYTEQMDALGTLDPGLQIVAINWPFPWFRPSLVKRMNLRHEVMSQVAAFNHGLRILGGLSPFGVNLDMDEYLYNASGTPLAELLSRHTRVLPCRVMASYRIPGITDMNHGKHARAIDFQYMPSSPYSWDQLFWGAKSFYRTGRSPFGMMQVEHITTHAAHLKLNFIAKIRHWGRKLSGIKSVFIFRSQKMNPALLRIYHYKGMGPNWHAEKSVHIDPKRWDMQPPDPQKHVRFEEVARLMQSVGLGKAPGDAA